MLLQIHHGKPFSVSLWHFRPCTLQILLRMVIAWRSVNTWGLPVPMFLPPCSAACSSQQPSVTSPKCIHKHPISSCTWCPRACPRSPAFQWARMANQGRALCLAPGEPLSLPRAPKPPSRGTHQVALGVFLSHSLAPTGRGRWLEGDSFFHRSGTAASLGAEAVAYALRSFLNLVSLSPRDYHCLNLHGLPMLDSSAHRLLLENKASLRNTLSPQRSQLAELDHVGGGRNLESPSLFPKRIKSLCIYIYIFAFSSCMESVHNLVNVISAAPSR